MSPRSTRMKRRDEMSRQNRLPLPGIICLSLLILANLGCNNRIYAKLGKGDKVILHLQQHDFLQWEGSLRARFQGVAPCVEGSANLKQCTVSIPGSYGHYRYTCTGCKDPEVEVGSIGIERTV